MPKPHYLALCYELPRTLPDWILLVPAGAFQGQDGRQWNNVAPERVVQDSNLANIPWDIEHATHIKGPKGEEAPAYGWVENLEVRDGAVWGKVNFNTEGALIVSERKYRYYSPSFYFDAQGVVSEVVSVGFTNQPNLKLPALNRKEEELPMPLPLAIVTALGLTPQANEEQVVTSIETLKNDKQLALNRAETPPLDKFVPTATHELALNRATTAEQKLKDIHDAEITALVDGAITDGKVAPANKDMYLATCRAEGGVEQFKNFIASAPKLVSTDTQHKQKKDGDTSLTEGELAMCRSMGLTKEQFLSAKPSA
ncbi:I protein [Moritella viscosa]|uniref:phage protease n=1 Tax=Moritella viscosa TaxID=80854 RepID=UPI0009234516|nr:phage protease [Moritella viscosa]SHO20112.1 I protein [Moritella viscosa]